MSMRRFFRAHRDEDYSQIQYLTAKCTRLAHDKALLDRDFLVSRDRERKLQNDLEAAASRIFQQEQLNTELRMNQDRLVSRIHQQQDLVDLLQRRLALLAEDGSRDTELLRQIGSELLCLQSSEVKLQGLVEELHAEAQHRAVLTHCLHAELQSQTAELQELQQANRSLMEELRNLHKAHQEQVRDLQRENAVSLKKLQDTAEQFEWLCEQQRYWMCCVKRFKERLMEEREALQQQLHTLNGRDEEPAQSLYCPLQDTLSSDRNMAAVDAVAVTDPESRVEKSDLFHQELLNQPRSMGRYQNPP